MRSRNSAGLLTPLLYLILNKHQNNLFYQKVHLKIPFNNSDLIILRFKTYRKLLDAVVHDCKLNLKSLKGYLSKIFESFGLTRFFPSFILSLCSILPLQIVLFEKNRYFYFNVIASTFFYKPIMQ